MTEDYEPNWANMPFSKEAWESANFDEQRGMLKKVVAKACRVIREESSHRGTAKANITDRDVDNFVEQMARR